MHRTGNVLDLLLTPILEPDVELIAHLIVHHAADADPARLGQGFEPRSNIHPVAEDVMFLSDHVAEIDPHPKPDAPLVWHLRLAVDHPALDLHGAAHSATTLANSANKPSPVFLTVRPRCS